MGEMMNNTEMLNKICWAKERIDEHIGTVIGICDDLRAGKKEYG
jgi:hypothetical protein